VVVGAAHALPVRYFAAAFFGLTAPLFFAGAGFALAFGCSSVSVHAEEPQRQAHRTLGAGV
jgi:hypothetical protein